MNSRSVMGRIARLLAVVCACAGIAACASDAPAAEPASTKPSPKQVFARACSKCHGAEGRGGLPMIAGGPAPRDLRDATWQSARSDNELRAAIRDGRGAMPPFRDVLTAAEQEAVLEYVREIGRTGDSARKDGR